MMSRHRWHFLLFATLLTVTGCTKSLVDDPMSTNVIPAVPIELPKGKLTPLSSESASGLVFLEADASATKAKLRLVKLGGGTVWEKWCDQGKMIVGTSLFVEEVSAQSVTVSRTGIPIHLDK